jgi:general stress protein 26
MTKQEAIDLIKDAGYGVMCTLENGQPKARPMMPYLDDEGNLLLAVLGQSRCIQQIKANPAVEFCFIDRKMSFARVSGLAKISTNLEKKELVWNYIPMLRQYFGGPDDANYVLLEIETTQVEATTPHQKQPDILSFK